jgi:dTDP-4-amino-4,6-dideoxy-D-galactose acyltransferase
MIKPLSWDTAFFGFPVGQIYLAEEPDWETFIPSFIQDAASYRLIYFVTDENCMLPDRVLKNINGRYINQRVVYKKPLSKSNNNYPKNISEYKETLVRPDFIELAYLCGHYSRFRVDTNFPTGKFEELYETWIKKSLERSLADKVFVASQNGGVTALVTSKYDDALCKIGLVAVSEPEQGNRTGFYLIQMAEESAFNEGLTGIQVATQSNNPIACRFYERLGFSLVERSNYYHIWVK